MSSKGKECTAEALTSTKYDRIASLVQEDLPASFLQNTQKEELCLEYVENFRDQFTELFPDRPTLLLTAKNEAAVEKLVTATIRPSQLLFKGIYDVKPCAEFIANYIQYEPLVDPTNVVKYLPAPSTTLAWRVGDCFDMATLLCSLLLGNGYDAYCVTGTAPKYITRRDTSDVECTYQPPDISELDYSHAPSRSSKPASHGTGTNGTIGTGRRARASTMHDDSSPTRHSRQPSAAHTAPNNTTETDKPSPAVTNKYITTGRPSIQSKYLQLIEQREKEQIQQQQEQENYESDADDEEEDMREMQAIIQRVLSFHNENGLQDLELNRLQIDMPTDQEKKEPLYRQRVHCWVLVRAGSRDVDDHFFVEPTTGIIYPVTKAPYYTIETVWNHENIWVNMQQQTLVPNARLPKNTTEKQHQEQTKANETIAARLARHKADRPQPEFKEDEIQELIEVGLYEPDIPAPLKSIAQEVMSKPRLILTDSFDIIPESKEETKQGEESKEMEEQKERLALSVPVTNNSLGTHTTNINNTNTNASNTNSIATLAYDLTNTDDWEFVFFTSMNMKQINEREDDRYIPESGTSIVDDTKSVRFPASSIGDRSSEYDRDYESASVRDREKEEETEDTEVLDPPPTWTPRINLARTDYQRLYGNTGRKQTLWRRCKLERYAPLVHAAGLEARLLEYTDASRFCLKKVTEIFSHRRDKLVKRIRWPLKNLIEEYFAPGRTEGLKMVYEELGKHRVTEFYTSSRLDGLQRRDELFGKKISMYFENTRNHLTYRSATLGELVQIQPKKEVDQEAFDISTRMTGNMSNQNANETSAQPNSGIRTLETECGTFTVKKMAEKFARSEDISAYENIAKLSYLLDEQLIQASYHHASGRITANTRLYSKSGSAAGTMEMITQDPFAPIPTAYEIERDFRHAVAAEVECYNAIRSAQKHSAAVLAQRQWDETTVALDKTVFEIAQEKAESGAPLESTEENYDGEQLTELDYLAPYLHEVRDANNMSWEEANKVRRAARNTLAERKRERARIIQARLDEENAALQRKQREFARNRDHIESADEEFEKYCAEAMFRIGILEQRLKRQDEVVAEKLIQLDQKFRTDPRLAILYSGQSADSVEYGSPSSYRR